MVATFATWVILMGLVGIALVTLLTIMVIAALVAWAKRDASGPSLTAIFGVVVLLLGVGLLLPFGIAFLSHRAAVPTQAAQAVSAGTHAITTAARVVAYEGVTVPARVIGNGHGLPIGRGSPKLLMLLVVGGFLLLVWMLSKEKTRAIGSWVLGIGTLAILLGGGMLLLLVPVAFQSRQVSHVSNPPSAFVTHRSFVAERLPEPLTRGRGTGLQQIDVVQAQQAVGEAPNSAEEASDLAAADAQADGAATDPPEASDHGSNPKADLEPSAAEATDDLAASSSSEPAMVEAAPAAVAVEHTAGPDEDVVPPAAHTAAAHSTTLSPSVSGAAHAAVPRQPMPEWVKIPPKLVGNSYRRTAVSDPFSTDDECRRQLDGRMNVITCEYLGELLGINDSLARSGGPTRERFAKAMLRDLGISPVYIRKNICRDEYIEHIGSSVDQMIGSGFGQMRRIHVLMEFDDAVQADLKKRWKDSRLVERLAVVGGGAFGIVAIVGLLFAYLKFDTATKGYYTRWLQVAIGLVTILVVAALTVILA